MDDDIIGLPVGTLAALVADRRVSPVEIVDAYLARTERLDDTLHAFVEVTAEQARRTAAARSEEVVRGELRGPLHGIPVGIKDNIDTAGVRTTSGSRILADYVPEADADVVQRLTDAGAIVLGKLNLHEFAFGGTTVNPHTGTTRNPWDPSRTVGGSSGGSGAAVAARCCPAALGTDTGGSVRAPAGLNGVCGLRPTYGLVSNEGVMPLAWSLDAVGPLAVHAADCRLVVDVLAETPLAAGRWGAEGGLRGLRLGIDEEFALGHVQPAVGEAFGAAVDVLRDLGAEVVPLTGMRRLHDDLGLDVLTVMVCEAVARHEHWLAARRDEYGADVLELFELGESMPAARYILAQRHRQDVRRYVVAEVLGDIDMMVTPTLPAVATPIGATHVEIVDGEPEDFLRAMGPFLPLPPATGLPALSVPCGFGAGGLPVGFHLVGGPFGEADLLAVGEQYQAATSWHEAVPRPADVA